MKRMLVTLNDPPYEMLQQMAKRRGITVQMMLKCIVIPQWLEERTSQVSIDGQMPESIPSEDSKRQAPAQRM